MRASANARIRDQASNLKTGEINEHVVTECRIGGNKRWLWLMCCEWGDGLAKIGLIEEREEEAH